MKVNWIFEKNMFEEYEQQLVDAIKNSGHKCNLLDRDFINFNLDKFKNRYKDDDCVIFYGSLNFGQRLWRDTNFIPGVFNN